VKRLGRLVLVILILAGGAAWWMHARLTTPYRAFDGAEVFVELPPGSGVADIARRLAAAGVVPDPYTFRFAVYRAGVA
jgi:cell division protein YceG involved in septum cleavage